MHKRLFVIGAVCAAIAVIFGATGAHRLPKIVGPAAVATFDTGVRYQFYHSLAILIAAIGYDRLSSRWVVYAGYCFLAGILLFSGSLYVLALREATEVVGLKSLGAITPIGGLLFVAGWVCMIISVYRANHRKL